MPWSLASSTSASQLTFGRQPNLSSGRPLGARWQWASPTSEFLFSAVKVCAYSFCAVKEFFLASKPCSVLTTSTTPFTRVGRASMVTLQQHPQQVGCVFGRNDPQLWAVSPGLSHRNLQQCRSNQQPEDRSSRLRPWASKSIVWRCGDQSNHRGGVTIQLQQSPGCMDSAADQGEAGSGRGNKSRYASARAGQRGLRSMGQWFFLHVQSFHFPWRRQHQHSSGHLSQLLASSDLCLFAEWISQRNKYTKQQAHSQKFGCRRATLQPRGSVLSGLNRGTIGGVSRRSSHRSGLWRRLKWRRDLGEQFHGHSRRWYFSLIAGLWRIGYRLSLIFQVELCADF